MTLGKIPIWALQRLCYVVREREGVIGGLAEVKVRARRDGSLTYRPGKPAVRKGAKVIGNLSVADKILRDVL